MIPEDRELNFADPQEPEYPVVLQRPVHQVPQDSDYGILVFLITAALLVFGFLIRSTFHSPTTDPAATQSTALSQNVQTPQAENQAPEPDYFPAGWSYIRASQPTEMYKGNQIYTIHQDCTFFVSLRNTNGFYLAVAEDGTWSGWVRATGAERQIPMHPDFAGAKKFVEKVDWNFLESSSAIAAPSQEETKTDLGALGAFESQSERSTMLFQKKDSQQDHSQLLFVCHWRTG